jgi:hypothetical protein
MTTKLFKNKNGGLPFPRTEQEWIEKKMSQGMPFEDASQFATKKVRDDVFGVDHKVDASGKPIENGIGSERNQTTQHRGALQIAAAARSAMQSRVGFTPTLVDAFDPRDAYIAELQAKLAKHEPVEEIVDPRDVQIADLEAKLAELKRPN